MAGAAPAIVARIDALILYARYVELFAVFSSTPTGPDRQKAFETLIRHTYRMRMRMMVHAKALYKDLAKPKRGYAVSIPKGAAWDVPEDTNPWKNSREFTDVELERLVREGRSNRRPR